MIAVIVSLLAIGSAALTIASFASWGIRQGFEPFDAILLSVAAYIGFLVVAGLGLDLVFDNLTRPYLLGAVAAAGLVSAAVVARAARREGGSIRRSPRLIGRPTAGAIAGLVAGALGLACVTGAIAFSRHTEQQLLVQRDIALYFDARTQIVAVHNPTALTQRLSLSSCPAAAEQPTPGVGAEAVSIVLARGQTWRAPASRSAGRCEVVVRQGGRPPLTLLLNEKTVNVGRGSVGTGW